MSRIYFREELEGIATFWRIHRRDGATLGFTAHNRDLWFGGICHRAAPGMLPSAIRRTAGIRPDSAEAQGALSHDSIIPSDLSAGRFDGARIEMGVVDWENLDHAVLYMGEVGSIGEDDGTFSAELRSAKTLLEIDPIPRTSPTCRARFCGPGCSLSAHVFTHEAQVSAIDLDANSVRFSGGPAPTAMLDGSLRWIDGPHAGLSMEVISEQASSLVLDVALDPDLLVGARALLREGCDHTMQTCSTRFGNSINFQGEPFLPGNDLLARYPTSSS